MKMSESKSRLVIAQACLELQTALEINDSTFSCIKILKSGIIQASRKKDLAPHVFSLETKAAKNAL